jgi:hypothetical protein
MNHNEKTIPDAKDPNIDTSALSHISIEIVKTPRGMSIPVYNMYKIGNVNLSLSIPLHVADPWYNPGTFADGIKRPH